MASNEDLKVLPNVDEIRLRFETFKNQFRGGILPNIIKDEYYNKVVIFNYHAKRQKASELNKIRIFRVRKNINAERERENLISTYSYPPPILSHFNGRCNIAGYPVFYGATSKNAAIFESKLKIGDHFYFTEWKVDINRDTLIANLLPPTLPIENPLTNIAREWNENAMNQIQKISPDKAESFMYILNEWVKIFIEEEYPYTLSSWFAYHALYESNQKSQIDAILYPSIATKQTGLNIVLHPNFVDQYLRLDKIFKCKILNFDGDKYEYGVGYRGDLSTGNILWQKSTVEDGKYFDLN